METDKQRWERISERLGPWVMVGMQIAEHTNTKNLMAALEGTDSGGMYARAMQAALPKVMALHGYGPDELEAFRLHIETLQFVWQVNRDRRRKTA